MSESKAESAHVRIRQGGAVHATSKFGVWHTLCGISAQDRWFYPTRNVVTCARCQDERVALSNGDPVAPQAPHLAPSEDSFSKNHPAPGVVTPTRGESPMAEQNQAETGDTPSVGGVRIMAAGTACDNDRCAVLVYNADGPRPPGSVLSGCPCCGEAGFDVRFGIGLDEIAPSTGGAGGG